MKSCDPDGKLECGDGFCCIQKQGWEGVVPQCGGVAKWIEICNGSGGGQEFSCVLKGKTQTQQCQ